VKELQKEEEMAINNGYDLQSAKPLHTHLKAC
jgi:hypothetical protein